MYRVRSLPLLIGLLLVSLPGAAPHYPDGFVEIREVIPDIVVELRYAGSHNFLGRPVAGYHAERCLITLPAARALERVQAELRPMGLSLKIYDAYRPQRAVDDFVRWAADPADTLTRGEFYPTLDKPSLFEEGYVARRSSHSRGSTVDLTIVPASATPQPPWTPGDTVCPCFEPLGKRFPDNSIDMGTGYDCFHPTAWTASEAVPPQARANRLLLKTLMERHGFRNYDKEWWHYTLRGEPFPDTYFDFPIE